MSNFAAEDLISLGISRILEQFGVGKSKQSTILLPLASSFEEINNALLLLASQKKWPLLSSQAIEEKYILFFQIGQWGLSISGAQRATIILFKYNGQIAVYITSKSTMGQFSDWGANEKNIKIIKTFLEDTFADNNKKSEILALAQNIKPLKPKPSINPWFWVITILPSLLVSLFLVIKSQLYLNQIPTVEYQGKKIDAINVIIADKSKITLALIKYWNDHADEYPKTLAELVPTYLPSLPIDPVKNQPYEYHQLKNGEDYELCFDIKTAGVEKKDCTTANSFEPQNGF